mmetsp:Transcript_35647/g.58455  ORF Transcript_35647/g.58455 Transcript_35647/m.58455 type:complete len:273 (+) Transcript_35647:55-873(+)|eukprot:CAMPEP_0202696858 /NCGR_PEP_ID=MMETSP1385-20130828/10187_1 /ASSEMBLY_ACC=CAM_ASM_000861 /TAXON_ID=933848 /ORGANISM="Elphidium margaritaceum" /LENGTH=272 /DNA_ID=CAMNT_0049353157 /DNA_START=22 /DNA_END=840 /DNA_ORIENTATION=-
MSVGPLELHSQLPDDMHDTTAHDDESETKQQSETGDASGMPSDQLIQQQLAELEALKPARSGYMFFAQLHRKESGSFGAVAEQSKRISAAWNALSESEKEEWNHKVESARLAYEQYLEQHPELHRILHLQEEEKRNAKNKSNTSFPLVTIKKLVLKNEDIGRISKEALTLINHSARLFIEDVVKQCSEQQTLARKSKTMTEQDFINTIHADSKYMFLRHVFKKNKHAALGVKRASTTNRNEPPAKKAKLNHNQKDVESNNRDITQFFNRDTK